MSTTTKIQEDQESAEKWRWPEGLHFVRCPKGLRQKIGNKGFILWECLADAAGSDPLTFISQSTIQERCGLTPRQQTYWANELSNLHDDDGRPYLEVIAWASDGMIKGSNVYVVYPFAGDVRITDAYIKERRHFGQRYQHKQKVTPVPEVAPVAPSPSPIEPEPEWAQEARKVAARRMAEFDALERYFPTRDDAEEMAYA
jgi:hypothetical protein